MQLDQLSEKMKVASVNGVSFVVQGGVTVLVKPGQEIDAGAVVVLRGNSSVSVVTSAPESGAKESVFFSHGVESSGESASVEFSSHEVESTTNAKSTPFSSHEAGSATNVKSTAFSSHVELNKTHNFSQQASSSGFTNEWGTNVNKVFLVSSAGGSKEGSLSTSPQQEKVGLSLQQVVESAAELELKTESTIESKTESTKSAKSQLTSTSSYDYLTNQSIIQNISYTGSVLAAPAPAPTPATVISGTSTMSLIESDVIQSASRTLNATNNKAFIVQSNVAGGNGYGNFSITATGGWTYSMSSAHNEFVSGQNYIDFFTVSTIDGITKVIVVTMTGTNDAAVIGGTSTASLTENNAIQSASGTLIATDVDSSAIFVTQSNVAGSNGYGNFSITATGGWTYSMSSAHNEFVGGQDYTDSFTVATADGTTQVITVTMTGTNDAPVVTNLNNDTLAYSEGNGAVLIDQSGNAAVSDVDSSNLDRK